MASATSGDTTTEPGQAMLTMRCGKVDRRPEVVTLAPQHGPHAIPTRTSWSCSSSRTRRRAPERDVRGDRRGRRPRTSPRRRSSSPPVRRQRRRCRGPMPRSGSTTEASSASCSCWLSAGEPDEVGEADASRLLGRARSWSSAGAARRWRRQTCEIVAMYRERPGVAVERILIGEHALSSERTGESALWHLGASAIRAIDDAIRRVSAGRGARGSMTPMAIAAGDGTERLRRPASVKPAFVVRDIGKPERAPEPAQVSSDPRSSSATSCLRVLRGAPGREVLDAPAGGTVAPRLDRLHLGVATPCACRKPAPRRCCDGHGRRPRPGASSASPVASVVDHAGSSPGAVSRTGASLRFASSHNSAGRSPCHRTANDSSP